MKHNKFMKNRTYVCIDLKSFYASVECVDRGLDPFTTNLVVADPDRSEKTICLAVSPAMKALGVPGRCRVFEIPKTISYIMATPRMQTYIDVSAKIYGVYLRFISKEDIHVYSIDEVFMDVTDYLELYGKTARELSIEMMEAVYKETGITATCGIGTNMYLAKIALDITAKHVPDHIGILDEKSYCEKLWNHLPLTDFWRIGPGTVRRLNQNGMETMGDVAHADPELLYHLFGIDAELLIDHSHGQETTTMKDIKAYRPRTNCISNGQVLPRDYEHIEGLLVVKEMADLLCLELVAKEKITESITLYLGYSNSLHMASERGSVRLSVATSSAKTIVKAVEDLYLRIKDPNLSIRRINLSYNNLMDTEYVQFDIFTDPNELERENKMQKAMLSIKTKYGKNAILKGMNLEDGGTTIERNNQIGGHRR